MKRSAAKSMSEEYDWKGPHCADLTKNALETIGVKTEKDDNFGITVPNLEYNELRNSNVGVEVILKTEEDEDTDEK